MDGGVTRATLRRRFMTKPVDLPSHPAVTHDFTLESFIGGAMFRFSGALPVDVVREWWDAWTKLLPPPAGVLTPAQVTDILTRAESLAARLEGLDAQTN